MSDRRPIPDEPYARVPLARLIDEFRISTWRAEIVAAAESGELRTYESTHHDSGRVTLYSCRAYIREWLQNHKTIGGDQPRRQQPQQKTSNLSYRQAMQQAGV